MSSPTAAHVIMAAAPHGFGARSAARTPTARSTATPRQHVQGEADRQQALEQRQLLEEPPRQRKSEVFAGDVQRRTQRQHRHHQRHRCADLHDEVAPMAPDDERDERQQDRSHVHRHLGG